MGRVIFKDLITLEEAIARLESELPPKPKVIEVFLDEALNKVLAEDVKAPINTPPYPRSLVDGYVVNYLDVKEASEDKPVKLKVKGRVRVGEHPDLTLRRGESVEIDTGAVIPKGGNAVVPVEETKCVDNYVLIYRPVGYGENIAWPGNDISSSELVATKGTLVTPELIGVLASLGISKVKVFRKPKVCIISTGNELIEPGNELIKGKVYDVNTYALTSKLKSLGYECISLGIVPDDEVKLRKVLSRAMELCDVVVISGGSSAGPEDLVYRVLSDLGKLIVHGIRLKPGKPTAIAVINDKPVFGLPGNPVSALMNFELIVKPYLMKLSGLKPPKPQSIKATLATMVKGAKGRRTYYPVKVFKGRGGYYAFGVSFESYMIGKFFSSDGYIIISEFRDSPLIPGELVDVYLLSNERLNYSVACFGEELDLITNKLRSEGVKVKDYICSPPLTKFVIDEYIADLVVTSELPKEIPKQYGVMEFRLKYVLAGRVGSQIALPRYPRGTLLEYLVNEVINILRLGEYTEIPVNSSKHALALLKAGYLTLTPLPKYLVSNESIVIRELGSRSLYLLFKKELSGLVRCVLS